jgi:prevent-host-death family protein
MAIGNPSAQHRSATLTHMDRIGIRALQQNASAVVARAEAGEVIEITDRGRPVARLVPVRASSHLQALVDAGRLRLAKASLKDTPPPLPAGARSLSEILAEMRANER